MAKTIKILVKDGEISKVIPRCQELCYDDSDDLAGVHWKVIGPGIDKQTGKEEELDLHFTVMIVGEATPFGSFAFNGDTLIDSGPITSSAPPSTHDQIFRYLIVVDGCPNPVDPGIIVWKQ